MSTTLGKVVLSNLMNCQWARRGHRDHAAPSFRVGGPWAVDWHAVGIKGPDRVDGADTGAEVGRVSFAYRRCVRDGMATVAQGPGMWADLHETEVLEQTEAALSEMEVALRHAEAEVARMAPSFDQRRLRQRLAIVVLLKAEWVLDPPSPPRVAVLARIVLDVLREASLLRETGRVPGSEVSQAAKGREWS